MDERRSVTRMLVGHFFRRFFDNDTIQVDGDTLTTVVRAISIVAVPGPMIAFFMQNQYPWRSLWGRIEDEYLFVLISFVVMGAVSIFEWEMLFPDRLDFLILSPLSLKPMQMLAAKAAALIGFLALFLVACNLFGTFMLPAITRYFVMVNGHLAVRADFFRQMYAQGTAVLLAGVFAALFFLALGGVLLCMLNAAQFRVASPIVQILSVMVLMLFMLHYAKYSDSMRALLSEPLGMARWMPPLWFLGVYEQLLRGGAAPAFAREMTRGCDLCCDCGVGAAPAFAREMTRGCDLCCDCGVGAAPAFAREMTRYAVRGTAIAAAVVLLTYPMAWARMRKMAIEGGTGSRRQPTRWLVRLVHGVVRRPGERAVFHFIGQTIARNNRYQVYLAMYCGTGLALAVACAVTFRVNGGNIQPALSDKGLYAMMPLLLFWVIAGLRTAFAFPLNLSAGWVFRITGVNIGDCAAAARRWVLLCALGVMCCLVAALALARWDVRHLLVQAVCGLFLCILLTDGFFFAQESVPFNRPRMPGKSNFALMLTLYMGVFPPFIFSVIYMEMLMEKNLAKLVLLGLVTAAIHAAAGALRTKSQEVEEEMEGYDGEFQLLGLSLRR